MSTTESSESFQISREIAEFYETAFVPAFFAQWAPILCQAAGVAPGHRVLDVGCGTGIVTRAAADRVAPDGRTVGVDLNEAMLSVARRVRPDIEFSAREAPRSVARAPVRGYCARCPRTSSCVGPRTR